MFTGKTSVLPQEVTSMYGAVLIGYDCSSCQTPIVSTSHRCESCPYRDGDVKLKILHRILQVTGLSATWTFPIDKSLFSIQCEIISLKVALIILFAPALDQTTGYQEQHPLQDGTRSSSTQERRQQALMATAISAKTSRASSIAVCFWIAGSSKVNTPTSPLWFY